MNTFTSLLADLHLAYFAACKLKRKTRSRIDFEANLAANLTDLCHEINRRTYKVERSICFFTNLPVRSEIVTVVFRDRVVHQLLYNYISPILKRTFVEPPSQHHHPLTLTIENGAIYIDRQLLFNLLMDTLYRFANRLACGQIKWKQLLDYELLEYLMGEIVFHSPVEGRVPRDICMPWEGLPPNKCLFYSGEGRGSFIGNLMSQLFADIYLLALDNYLKRTSGEVHCGPYAEDFCIVSADKEQLLQTLPLINSYLERKLRLPLYVRKIVQRGAVEGMGYLGVVARGCRFGSGRKPNKRVNKSFKKMIRRPGLSEAYRIRITHSYLGYMQHIHLQSRKNSSINRKTSLSLLHIRSLT